MDAGCNQAIALDRGSLPLTYEVGELTERVTFVRVTETQNEYGTLVPSEANLGTVWAHVRPMSGREIDRAQQTEGRVNYLVVVRNLGFVRELTEKDIARWNGDDMNIRVTKHRSARADWLELECERGAPQ